MESDQEIRAQALDNAVRVMAAVLPKNVRPEGTNSVSDVTIAIAEKFEQYIRNGTVPQ